MKCSAVSQHIQLHFTPLRGTMQDVCLNYATFSSQLNTCGVWWFGPSSVFWLKPNLVRSQPLTQVSQLLS